MIYFIIAILSLFCVTQLYQFNCNSSQWRRQPRLFLNNRQVLTLTSHNYTIIVDSTDEMVSQTILIRGSWQPQLLFLIAQLVKPGMHILNLGAHVGQQAILMGKLLEGHGKIYVFEPYSASYRMLVKSVYINDLAQIITCYRLAAGDQETQLRLKIDKQNTGHSHIFQGPVQQETTFQLVNVERVDAILPASTKLDFALIDVQMHEVEALLGMRQIISQSLSLIILLEWRFLSNPYGNRQQTEQLLKWLDQMKFKWVRYSQAKQCQLGSFEVLEWSKMLEIKEEDLLLVGPEANLEKKLNITLL